MEKEARVYGEGGRRQLCATCASSQVCRRRHLSAARFSTCTQKRTLKPLKTWRNSKTRRTVSHSELNFYRSNTNGANPLSRKGVLSRMPPCSEFVASGSSEFDSRIY
jgi:hypothetical protein